MAKRKVMTKKQREAEMLSFEFTRERAKELGLLQCYNCGWPENNHFDFGVGELRPSAHDKKCKDFLEVQKRSTKAPGYTR